MTVSKQCQRVRTASKTRAAVSAALLAALAGSGGGVGPVYAGAIAEPPRVEQSRNVERAISDALAPPRQRCAELRAAINQAVTDARSSQGTPAYSQFGWDRRSGAGPSEPPGGSGADRRTRLENEYAQLNCARRAP